MSDSNSIVGTSYIQNTIQHWRNKVFNTKVKASLESNMADKNHKQSLEEVRKIAQELGDYIIHYVAGYNDGPPPNKHAKTLKRTVDEMLTRHEIAFNALVRKIEPVFGETSCHLLPYGSQAIHETLVEMFSDKNLNWGRIVSVYAFGGRLAKHFVDKDMPQLGPLPQLVDYIEDCINNFVCANLATWIYQKGGWTAFDEFFPDLHTMENNVWGGLMFAAVGLGAMAAVHLVAVR